MKKAGYLVETKKGFKGKTYHHEKKVNKKTVVHLDDSDIKMLCDPKTLIIKGFFDETDDE